MNSIFSTPQIHCLRDSNASYEVYIEFLTKFKGKWIFLLFGDLGENIFSVEKN